MFRSSRLAARPTRPWVLLGLAALACAACATAKPPAVSRLDQWRRDLNEYAERLQKFDADVRQLLEDYDALRDDPSFPGVEAKVKDTAERILGGEQSRPNDLLIKSLYTMSLGELMAFHRFLAFSSRVATLEATQSELERLRLDLRFRGVALEQESPLPAEEWQKVAIPASTPHFSCARYVVGQLVFANCREGFPGPAPSGRE